MTLSQVLQWRPGRWDRWLGDRARGRRDWPLAARRYERHLGRHPRDQAIWVQLGHARKEAGERAGARAAYWRALALDPADADALRHFKAILTRDLPPFEARLLPPLEAGEAPPEVEIAWPPADDVAAGPDLPPEVAHLIRLGGQLEAEWRDAEFQARLRRALAADPRFATFLAIDPAKDEVFDVRPLPLGRCLMFDISDLLSFLADFGFVTGIQRVQSGVLEALLDHAERPAHGFERIVFTFSEAGWPWALDVEALKAIAAYVAGAEVDAFAAARLVDRARARARLSVAAPGSAHLTLGGFWGGPAMKALQTRLRSQGVAVGVLVHDVFAVTLPDFCAEGMTATFEKGLREGVSRWDFAVTNSRFTAQDLAGCLTTMGLPVPPIFPVPLAHGSGAVRASSSEWPASLAALEGRSFALCVATIEPRKNHLALIEAWTALCRSHPGAPALVLVGRRGWRMKPILERLEASGLLGTQIIWFEDVSDAELEALYRGCRFAVLPSFAEGWGLPVGEALVRGKVCLASNTTALPEVGGEFARYVDPRDADALLAEIEALSFDDQLLERLELTIAQHFKPRTWADVAEDMVAAAAKAVAAKPLEFLPRAPCTPSVSPR
jgi:glycosyltransferase involved in cell wall biosynthesis